MAIRVDLLVLNYFASPESNNQNLKRPENELLALLLDYWDADSHWKSGVGSMMGFTTITSVSL